MMNKQRKPMQGKTRHNIDGHDYDLDRDRFAGMTP
jgi:hypothetical protein